MRNVLGLAVLTTIMNVHMVSPDDLIPSVILDTDMRGDCDDAGALATLHALADNGECKILGVMATTLGAYVVGAIGAINTYYGRPDLPVGFCASGDTQGQDEYAPIIGDPSIFPGSVSNQTAPDSTVLYRKLLHAAPDKSVTIVVIGGQSAVRDLLHSAEDYEGDQSISQTGKDLIRTKVKELVLMAGNFADSEHIEANIRRNIPVAQTIAQDWPSPIVYSGFEIGRDIMTGARLRYPETNPVAMSYKLYPGTEGGKGVIGNRPSWDQTVVYYAVRGLDYAGQRIWAKEGPVRVSFTDEGKTRFDKDLNATRFYLVHYISVEDIAQHIENLMIQPPYHIKME